MTIGCNENFLFLRLCGFIGLSTFRTFMGMSTSKLGIFMCFLSGVGGALLCQKDPLEKEMATYSSILAWRIPWTEEPGKLQSMGRQRVKQDWVTNTLHFTFFILCVFVILLQNFHKIQVDNVRALGESDEYADNDSMASCYQFSSVQSLSRVRLFMTPCTTARQASLSITNSQNLLKLMSIEPVMPSNHLIVCHPLLLPPIPPSIRVFSSESTLCMTWPKFWSFSFSISLSNEYSGLISFRTDWFDLLGVQGTLKSLLQYHSLKSINSSVLSLLYGPTPTSIGEGNGNLFQHSCLENPMDRRAWQATVHGVASVTKSRT